MNKNNLFFKNFISCSECKKEIPHLNEELFINDGDDLCFCQDKCIIKFLSPWINFWDTWDKEKRLSSGIVPEQLEEIENQLFSNNETIQNPAEIMDFFNKQKWHFSFLMRKYLVSGEDIFHYVICLNRKEKPSVILHQGLTKHDRLIVKMKLEIKQYGNISQDKKMEKIEEEIPQALITVIERKKSEELARLLELRQDWDISFEAFSDFEYLVNENIKEPDESFSNRDEEGNLFVTFIKSYEKNQSIFFYVVLCYKGIYENNKSKDVYIPIISFPSKDKNLYKAYSQGVPLKEYLKS